MVCINRYITVKSEKNAPNKALQTDRQTATRFVWPLMQGVRAHGEFK